MKIYKAPLLTQAESESKYTVFTVQSHNVIPRKILGEVEQFNTQTQSQ